MLKEQIDGCHRMVAYSVFCDYSSIYVIMASLYYLFVNMSAFLVSYCLYDWAVIWPFVYFLCVHKWSCKCTWQKKGNKYCITRYVCFEIPFRSFVFLINLIFCSKYFRVWPLGYISLLPGNFPDTTSYHLPSLQDLLQPLTYVLHSQSRVLAQILILRTVTFHNGLIISFNLLWCKVNMIVRRFTEPSRIKGNINEHVHCQNTFL